MCTALTLKSSFKENFFGRNMDFSHNIEPGLYIMPRKHQWYDSFTNRKYCNHYSFIGIGQETEGILGFFDGVNENGFAAAALYFAGYADYDIAFDISGRTAISSLDFLHFILGRCNSIDDLYHLVKSIYILGAIDPVTKTAAPLHWIATDRSGKSLVIEQTKNGIEIFNNPIGVLANSPDFKWHMTNLRNYIEVSSIQKEEAVWGNIKLTPFGQAGGTSSLPGGFTSPERFVRTGFLKTHSSMPKNKTEAVSTFFHILGNSSIPKGLVETSRGSYDYTIYTCFMSTRSCEYFIKTHDNIQIALARLWDYNPESTEPKFLGFLKRPMRFEKF